jgi:hypothetical protein
MRIITFLAVACVPAVASSVEEVVDGLFAKYLPQKATWEEVKMCREKCGQEEGCVAGCPKFECPWKRIKEQCDIFNSTVAAAKTCHQTCQHDFACHFNCPMARPTTLKELHEIGEAMVCHTQCGKDKACHKSKCTNPWEEKHARCEQLEAAAACYKSGGSHSSCPHLDNETKMALMAEPWSLVKDLMNHVVDYILPLPQEQQVSVEAVRACHVQCGQNVACHKACPVGIFGRFKERCASLDAASACHKACADSKTECPFKKHECHFKCPMSMPTSVKELRGLTGHVLCHTTCGKDKACHLACPNSVWSEKKEQCKAYDNMMACHHACGHSHTCHASCPHLPEQMLNEVAQEPSSLVKDVIDVLVV